MIKPVTSKNIFLDSNILKNKLSCVLLTLRWEPMSNKKTWDILWSVS